MDDYISREEAKRFFNLNFGSVSHAIIASRLLDEIPAADVSPVRHAEWDIDKSFIPFVCTCSECCASYDADGAFEWNYCPNCGAIMDGGEQ